MNIMNYYERMRFFSPSKCNTHSFMEEIRKASKMIFSLPFVIVVEIWFSAFCEV